MHPGMIGGIAGGLIGLAGGIFGTYFSIKNTIDPCERAFVIKASIICWVAIFVFLGLLLTLPTPYKWFMWVPYSILLPLGIIYSNEKLQSIKQEESQNKANSADTKSSAAD